MNKLLLTFIGFSSIIWGVSCCNDQEDLNNILIEKNKNDFASRATTNNIANFDPLSEISNIPVNIVNVGNTKNKYLSCNSTGQTVKLASSDDGSNRQRWYIKNKSAIQLVGGNSMCSSDNYVYITAPINTVPSTPSIGIGSQYPISTMGFVKVSDGIYQIANYPQTTIGGSTASEISYLQSKSTTGSNLEFNTGTGDLSKWQIYPAGDFNIVDIDYTEYDGGSLTESPESVTTRVLDNPTSIPATRTFTDEITVEETSKYSAAEGISFGTTFSITTPIGGPGDPTSGSVTMGQSASKSWTFTFETTQKNSRKMSDTFSVTVPAYTKYTVTTYVRKYHMNIKYVATLEDANGNRFRVKGIWTGTSAYEIYQKCTEGSTGTTFILNQEEK